MAPRRGEIILIPFPYSDLSAAKTRPALTISIDNCNQRGETVIVYLTSKIPLTLSPFDYLLQDWAEAKLLKPTLSRPRLAIVSNSLIQLRIGAVTQRDFAAIADQIKGALVL